HVLRTYTLTQPMYRALLAPPPLIWSLLPLLLRLPPSPTLFPYTTLFRSLCRHGPCSRANLARQRRPQHHKIQMARVICKVNPLRSEEHTSELQSHLKLVCRLLLEKKKQPKQP